MSIFKKRAARFWTTSVALPASIVENCQSFELKAMLVGQIARALTIYAVDEVVLYEDRSDAQPSDDTEGVSRGLAFFARNLQYLETPQYLRRQLVPMHPDLRSVGLLSPLDAPHHLRKWERLQYREGAVMGAGRSPKEPGGPEPGSWVNCGLDRPAWVTGGCIPSDVRVTVRLDTASVEAAREDPSLHARGAAVDPREPTQKLGLYWGYQTRIANSFRGVFDECPYEGGYDLTIGTSERGEVSGFSRLPKFKHLLLVFGGVGGLEDVLSDERSGYDGTTDPKSLFTRYVNVCSSQASRTIRTEEALIIALTALSPYMP